MHNINLVIDSRERGCKVSSLACPRTSGRYSLAELPSYAEIVDSEQGMRLEKPDEVKEQ